MGALRSEATIFTSFIRGKPKVETATERTMKNRGQVSRVIVTAEKEAKYQQKQNADSIDEVHLDGK